MYAAQSVLPYCAAKLQQVDMKVESSLESLSMAEKVALAASLRDRILEHAPGTKLPKLPTTIEAEVEHVE